VRALDKSFPFRDIFTQFLQEYSESVTYWYVPKTRVLSDENVEVITRIIKVIFNEFLEHIWNVKTQDKILSRLVKLKIVSPTKRGGTQADRAALIRIWKKLLETLGLLWVQDDREIVITDAGLDLLSVQAEGRRSVIEKQIIKYQYPNPSLTGLYAESFKGLLPHVFLLQVLRECENRVTSIEYELFINLSKSQEDVGRVVRYIHSWRDINEREKQALLKIVKQLVIKAKAAKPEASLELKKEEERFRFERIHLNASYQKPFFAFPGYVNIDDEGEIVCVEPDKVNELLSKLLPSLKITKFRTLEDWFAYFGDPKKEPSWLTYLISIIEDATTGEAAKEVVEEHKALLKPEEVESVEKAQIEKDIETFYFAHLDLLEKGLVVVKDKGRQFPTPIGRIDLLCESKEGEYVVVEIKADEARDSVFGQILRYIGWVHRNIEDARDKVRGIILASKFPETARYSRIGLLKPDYEKFIKFKEHGLNVQDT
jgi:hypothetical protein